MPFLSTNPTTASEHWKQCHTWVHAYNTTARRKDKAYNFREFQALFQFAATELNIHCQQAAAAVTAAVVRHPVFQWHLTMTDIHAINYFHLMWRACRHLYTEQHHNQNKAIVDYTSPVLCTPITPSRQQVMRPIVSMPEECRAAGNMHKKFGKDRTCGVCFRRYPCR